MICFLEKYYWLKCMFIEYHHSVVDNSYTYLKGTHKPLCLLTHKAEFDNP